MSEQQPRKRSLTSITLGWIAERVRKSERIKQELSEGKYDVESSKIAEALLTNKGTPE